MLGAGAAGGGAVPPNLADGKVRIGMTDSTFFFLSVFCAARLEKVLINGKSQNRNMTDSTFLICREVEVRIRSE